MLSKPCFKIHSSGASLHERFSFSSCGELNHVIHFFFFPPNFVISPGSVFRSHSKRGASVTYLGRLSCFKATSFITARIGRGERKKKEKKAVGAFNVAGYHLQPLIPFSPPGSKVRNRSQPEPGDFTAIKSQLDPR